VKAVRFIHSKRVVHGDIKLSNIMVDAKGEIQLIDFGFSAFVGDNSPTLTHYHGTPVYMAPEILDETPFDGKFD